MKKNIRVKFVDFWDGFDIESFFITQILREHFTIEYSENPDYLVYSCYGDKHIHYNNCVKIFYAGEYCFPDFNLCDYAIGYSRVIFEDRYHKLSLLIHYDNLIKEIINKKQSRDTNNVERGFCSFLYSNPNADPFRTDLFRSLNQYKKVDSGGGVLNNIGGFVENKYDFLSKYRFNIATENVSGSGYSSEKILDAFLANTIPIYWGDPLITEYINKNAFINCHDYKDMEEIVNAVKEIDSNPELYNYMITEMPIINYDEKYIQDVCSLTNFLLQIFSAEKKHAYRRTFYAFNHGYFIKYKRLFTINSVYENTMVKIKKIIKLLLPKKVWLKLKKLLIRSI